MIGALVPADAPAAPRRVSFQVFGVPRPKGSARAFVATRNGKPAAIITSDNKRLKPWEDAVRDAAQGVAGEVFFTDAAVRLEIEFWFPRPASAKRPYLTTKPDLSKLIRGAEDALTGVLFRDDCLITEVVATKRYVDGAAGARIALVEVLAPPPLPKLSRAKKPRAKAAPKAGRPKEPAVPARFRF